MIGAVIPARAREVDRGIKAVELQCMWFRADLWTKSAAKEWLDEHHLISSVYRTKLSDDGDVTHHLFPQFPPDDPRIEPDSWRTIADDFPAGISATTCIRREKNVMTMKFTKGQQSADNPMEFIMSDESVDRVGDIIEAKGWDLTQFEKNPIALYGHNHDKPIGTWENVRQVGKRLVGRLKLAAEGTSAEIDTIRSLIEQRILRAVSVGFQPVEAKPRKDGGYRFTKQILHECSLVAVPANANALAIAKSLGADPSKIFAQPKPQGSVGSNPTTGRAPIHGHGTGVTKGTASKAGVPHATSTSDRGSKPMKLSDRIAAKRERLVGIKDELSVLKSMAEDDNFETYSDADQERLDALLDEEQTVVKSIESLEKLEQGIAAKAQPAHLAARGVAAGAPAKKTKGGALMAKHITAQLFAHKSQMPLQHVMQELYGSDDQVMATAPLYSQKSAVPAADTQTGGWAAELVQEDLDAFLTELQPISVFAALRARGRGLSFGGMSSLKIPRRVGTKDPATNDLSGSFVGEGGVIPVKRAALTSQTLMPYKLAVISAWTNELAARSTPQIESMVREMILEDTAKALDAHLLDASAAVPGVRPAGLMNSVTATNSAGPAAANIITDLKVLFTAMQNARVGSSPVLILNSIRLLGLSTITTAAGGFMFRDEVAAGRLLGVPVIAAEHVDPDTVYIIDAASFVAANDTPMFKVSDEAVLTMANADGNAPTQAESSATAGDIGTADQVPPKLGIHVNEDLTQTHAANAQAVSLFQTYQTAIRMTLPTSWGMVRTGTVAAIDQVGW